MIFSYIAKGWTMGGILARTLLRNTFSFPGLIIDLFMAMFWLPDYAGYWRAAGISYADGTRVGPVMGVFGWIGEALGYAIGGVLGAIVGAAVFLPNALLMVAAIVQRGIYNGLAFFAGMIPNVGLFDRYFYLELKDYVGPGAKNAANLYMRQAWNIGAGSIGTVLAVIPYVLAKLIEYPFGTVRLSGAVLKASSFIGGVIGAVVAIPVFPVKFLIASFFNLLDTLRNLALNGMAILYGKFDVKPVEPGPHDCCAPDSIHSGTFRNKVTVAHNSSWAKLIFGDLRPAAPAGQAADVPADKLTADEEQRLIEDEDPITHEKFGYNGIAVAKTPCGHFYNFNSIHQVVTDPDRAKHLCSLDREPVEEKDLVIVKPGKLSYGQKLVS